jgi:ABC-type uncharacterized transport system substrate-binding protein
MERRTFLSGITLGLLAAPLAVGAQQAGKIYRIGYLSGNPRADTQEAIEAFIEALRGFGFVEGRNLAIEYRYADGNFDQLQRLVEELMQRKVDLILTYGTPATLAAKNATKTIPVLFGAVADPIVAELVPSLSRPGGNVTGTTTINPELSGKRLDLLKEALPRAGRIAVLANPNFPPTPGMIVDTRTVAATLGIEVRTFEARTPSELTPTFKAIATWKANALDVLPDAMFIAQHRTIVELAGHMKIPAIFHLRQFVETGGLMSYGPSYAEAFRRTAALVAKILQGAKPGDLPIEQPTKFEFVINMKTAKALGLTIPPSLLLRADEVIQ